MTKERFGVVTLSAEILMLISFFFIPNLSIGTMGFGRSFTGWEAVGYDPSMLSTSSHGLLNLLAIVALLAPVAAAFLNASWRRWLHVAPLAFVLLAVVHVLSEIHQASRGAEALLGRQAARAVRDGVSSMFSVNFGAYLVLICAVLLATRALQTRKALRAPSPTN